MNKELYKLFMDYQRRELDKQFIDEAYAMMIEDDPSLKPFIKKMDVSDDDNKDLGTYSGDDKEIIVYKRMIMEKPNQVIENKKLQALRVLRHEIEHARSFQKLSKRRNDIETEIIDYSLKDYPYMDWLESLPQKDREEVLYRWFTKKRNYLIDPEERLVDIRALKYLVNMLKSQKQTPDLLMARKALYFAYTRGYRKNGYYIDPPTYQFLLKMGLFREYYLLKKKVENIPDDYVQETDKKQDEKEKYAFETRLLYGLPLREQEFEQGILGKVRLVKVRKVDR